MNFLPSPTADVDGYEVSLGESSGSYDTVMTIPLSSIAVNGNSRVYDLILDSDRDYYMVLRAYNSFGTSRSSNEIVVGALSSPAVGAQGSSTDTPPIQATLASTLASALAPAGVTAGTGDVLSNAAAQPGVVAGEAAVADTQEDSVEFESGTSLDFDGEGEHLASLQSVALGTDDAFSFSIWVRPELDQAEHRTLLELADEASNANNATRLNLAVVGTGSVELTLHSDNRLVLYRARFDDVLLDGEWQHMALVFDATIDLEPRLYLDAQLQRASESVSVGAEWALSYSVRRVVIGSDATGSGDSWLGQLGHAALWNTALPDSVIEEVSVGGHDIDLRSAGAPSNAHESLMHYWRLGADADGIGFDHGGASMPLDLDGTIGRIDATDIFGDAPSMLQTDLGSLELP